MLLIFTARCAIVVQRNFPFCQEMAQNRVHFNLKISNNGTFLYEKKTTEWNVSLKKP